jgi:hypothetical protein
MLKKKHKLGVAAVLAGAALFSPLLCGMTCLETRVERASAAVEAAAPSEELMGELAKSEVVGCVLTHVVLRMDVRDWTEVARVGSRFWVGVEILRFVEGR